jgi:hypothetical protein
MSKFKLINTDLLRLIREHGTTALNRNNVYEGS